MGNSVSIRKSVETCPLDDRFPSRSYFQTLSKFVEKLPFADIDAAVDMLWVAFQQGQCLFLFGNGGSAALASHSACDLGKGTSINSNRRFRVMALTDNVPLITAWANDQGYEDIFAEQLRPFVGKGDVAFAISGSGNSPNILNGLAIAREAGAVTIGLSGFRGGKMKSLCDLCIVVPCDNMQVIEDLHVSISHSVFLALRERICQSQDVPIFR